MMEEIIRRGSLRLFATESSCDVVISCIGYKMMAHKIILSIASPVLQELLQHDTSETTVLIFADIHASTMSSILDYMYNGHVSLVQSEIDEFLSVATILNIKVDESYVNMFKKSCGIVNLKVSDHLLCKVESSVDYKVCKKAMPGLLPIGKMRVKKGLCSKVIPSPWTQREPQIFKDPRDDCIKSLDYKLQVDTPVTLEVTKNDTNNNIEEQIPTKPQETIVDDAALRLSASPEEKSPKETDSEGDAKKSEPGNVETSMKKEKPYKCSDCGKGFSQLRNYKYHRSIHDGTKEFSTKCPECGKVFNDRGYLSSHMKIHRDRKEYACQHCPKRFNQRVAYNMHLRIHTGVKPHLCNDCGKSFSRKMLLKQHQRVHTGERPYTCPECGKSFADRSNMSLHARLHTGVKPYSCTICNKSFTKKHHLKTHMNFHTGLKPYSCENCGLAFSQSSNMRTHYKKCILKNGDKSS